MQTSKAQTCKSLNIGLVLCKILPKLLSIDGHACILVALAFAFRLAPHGNGVEEEDTGSLP